MSRAPHFLLLGASGLIGRNLRNSLSPHDALMTYHANPFPGGVPFDPLTQRIKSLGRGVKACTHALILFADSKPDSCFANPDRTQAINVDCLQPLASDLLDCGIAPVFISTEFVFDGARGNYREDDPTYPILVYGRQKLAAEQQLAALDPSILILRLAKCFGSDPADGTLFTHWLAQLNRGVTHLACASDQIFSPLHAGEAAWAMLAAATAGLTGIFHLAGPQAYSRLALLELLLNEVRRHTPVELTVHPCYLRDFKLPEPRPLDVSLSTEKLRATGCLQTAPLADHCTALVAQWLETVPLLR